MITSDRQDRDAMRGRFLVGCGLALTMLGSCGGDTEPTYAALPVPVAELPPELRAAGAVPHEVGEGTWFVEASSAPLPDPGTMTQDQQTALWQEARDRNAAIDAHYREAMPALGWTFVEGFEASAVTRVPGMPTGSVWEREGVRVTITHGLGTDATVMIMVCPPSDGCGTGT